MTVVHSHRSVLMPPGRAPLQVTVGASGAAARQAPPAERDAAAVVAAAAQATRTLLDRVQDRFCEHSHDGGPAMLELQCGLEAVKSASTPEAWQAVVAECATHPVRDLVLQDPFTRHSHQRPRGYAGDAQLLDFIYGLSPAPEGTTPLGESVFGHMMQQQGAMSVRSRGDVLADAIDDTAAQFKQPRILSIACGHLREAARSTALARGGVGELIALDQDADSLAEVNRAYAGTAVRTVNASVRAILAEKVRFEGFHFVYAAGLYDYLSERVAARLTRLMFDMVVPGGRVLVANFAPTLPEEAYMETFMDWKLIYRTAEEMALVSQDVPGDAWKSSRLFWDEHANIIFLELVKRDARQPASRRGPGEPQGVTRTTGAVTTAGLTVPGMRNVRVARDLAARQRQAPPSARIQDDS